MIPFEEAKRALERVARGEIAADSASDDGEMYRLVAGGWTFNIFNDAGELDYLDSATAPDGRVGDFQEWCNEADDDPWSALTITEADKLTSMILERCRPMRASGGRLRVV